MNAPHRPPRKSTNVLLDAEMVSEAKAIGINLSRACEAGLAAAVRDERKRRWIEENRDAMEAWGVWHDQNGLPLAKYRQF